MLLGKKYWRDGSLKCCINIKFAPYFYYLYSSHHLQSHLHTEANAEHLNVPSENTRELFWTIFC